MTARDHVARLHAIGDTLARRAPGMLAAATALIESLLGAVTQGMATERTRTAPVALTAEQVLAAARARGVPAFTDAIGEQWILLASLGLDLTASTIRAALVELYRRGELRLASIADTEAVRADLASRGLPLDFIEASALRDGDAILHAVVLS